MLILRLQYSRTPAVHIGSYITSAEAKNALHDLQAM